jgi:hypothetical protein
MKGEPVFGGIQKKAGSKACCGESLVTIAAARSGAGLFVDRHLGWSLTGGADHIVNDAAKIFQTGGGNDDGVAASVDIFCDAQEAAAGIFLQGEKESFPFDLYFIAAQGILDHRGLVRLP